MLDIMGINTSVMTSFGSLFGGIDEEEAMTEFDDLRKRIRRCEVDYLQYQAEEEVIPVKINHMKRLIKRDDKMFHMITVLESEWMTIKYRVREFQEKQQKSLMYNNTGYACW